MAINPDSIIYQHPMSRNPLTSFTEWTDKPRIDLKEMSFDDYWRSGDGDPKTLFPPDGKTINRYIPVELLKEVLLYSIEVNQMTSGHLASVCRYWGSVITTIASLWSTLRVGDWTEKERVTTWFRRAYPKKVIIDIPKRRQWQSRTPTFSALQRALSSTDQWNELTISSFPPEDLISHIDFQVVEPMKVLKALHVATGCVYSPSLAHLLEAISMEAPLSELRLSPPFASAHFLRPQWLPVLQNLRVFVVNGRELDAPIHLLPTFTQLRILEADHLPLPLCTPNTELPLLSTLQRLKLRACSVQWMAGREFSCLVECAILLPRHWQAIQQHTVKFPSCRNLIYYHYPVTTVQYFHAPQLEELGLGSNDCVQRRVYQYLKHLWISNRIISQLTTLHLTLECSVDGLMDALRFMKPLQVLELSIPHPSQSWEHFLWQLAAKPSTKHWPEWNLSQVGAGHLLESRQWESQQWEKWCSSQTWHTNILPYLKSLGVQYTKGFPLSQCLEISPLFRLVAWTREKLIPPLEHLNVWVGDTVVDHISLSYLVKHLGMSTRDHDWSFETSTGGYDYDWRIVSGMLTKRLRIADDDLPLFKRLHSTILFRNLQALEFSCQGGVHILPCLEQIKELKIWGGDIPAYSLNIDLPLVHTLHTLKLSSSTVSWMIGRTFKALNACHVDHVAGTPEDLSGWNALQVDMPACTTLEWKLTSVVFAPFISCPNLQILQWAPRGHDFALDNTGLTALHNFLLDCSCLQAIEISIEHYLGLDSLIQLVFCDAWVGGALQGIKSVRVFTLFTASPDEKSQFFNRMVQYEQRYKKWWKEFTVENTGWRAVDMRAVDMRAVDMRTSYE